MSAMDKANEIVKIFDTVYVDDGYGTPTPTPAETYKTYRAYIIPTGFAGAGWAVNIRFAGQGWADTARVTAYIGWKPELENVRQFAQFEVRGQRWTLVQAPRRYITPRISFATYLLELRGDE